MKRWFGLLARILLLPATVESITFQQVLDSITPAAYEHMHTNLFVGDGMNRGFTGDLDGSTTASMPFGLKPVMQTRHLRETNSRQLS